jgi:hypothetical protein
VCGEFGMARWRCTEERAWEPAQVFEGFLSVICEVVCVVMVFGRMCVREVKVESKWRVQASEVESRRSARVKSLHFHPPRT